MIPSFLKVVCLFVLSGGLLFPTVTAEELSDEEVEGLLGELTTIEEVLNGSRVSLRMNAVRAFEAASASDKTAYDFFLQCHKTLRFDAKDASFSDFRSWRERNEDKIKTKSNLAALRLQLQYLVLTMKAAEGVQRETLIPELEKFVANIITHSDELEKSGMETLKGSVKTSIFAEAYNLHKSLELSDWCFEPGNFGGVYETTVFPFIRAEHKEALGATWDRRIDLEKKFILITHEENQFELNKFQTERLPELYWKKATDIYLNASPKQGAQSMLTLLKENPDHTSLSIWLNEFRSLLGGTSTMKAVPGSSTPPAN